jgi:SAM-dependent methyltransferase
LFTSADSYERFMGRWSRLLAPQFVEFAGIGDEQDVLDVGCGTGSLTQAILDAAPNARVSGIDPSPAFVAFATEHVPGARFEVGDAQHLPYGAHVFDAALALLVFNFFDDPKKALLEMRRVTRPGGCIAAVLWDRVAGMPMLHMCWEAAEAIDPALRAATQEPQPMLDVDKMEALWTSADLREVKRSALTITMRFAAFDDFWLPFTQGQGPAGAFVRGLSPELHYKLQTELRSRILKGGDDGPFALDARAWAVRGLAP